MNPQQLQSMINSGDPELIRQAQSFLQQNGFYTGSLDGSLGRNPAASATMRAYNDYIAAETLNSQRGEAELRQQELENERIRLEAEAAEREAARQERATQRQDEQQREESADPVMDTFAPFGAGAVAGGVYGEISNRGLDRFERGNVEALREIGDEIGPTSGMTSSQSNRAKALGAAKAAERFAPSNPLMKAAGVTGRAASYGIPAGLVFNEYQNYQERANDPNLTDAERQANQRVANFLLGTGTGIGAEGGRRFFFPTREPGMGQALARISAAKELATRMDAADARPRATPAPRAQAAATPPAQPKTETPKPASQPRPALPGSRADLMQQARRFDIPGRSKMKTAELRDAVAGAIKDRPAPRGGAATKMLKSPAFAPLAAGTLAYGMADAQAADGSGPSTVDKVGSAGVAGGTAYGANRLLQALPKAAKTAFAAGGEMAIPQMVSDMTDDFAAPQARNTAARYLPEALRFGAVEDAYQMAQVPERSPSRVYGNAYEPGGQPAGQPEEFDAELAEIQAILNELEGTEEAAQPRFQPPAPMPAFRVSPGSTGPQNRLLAIR